jgi:RNA polymerase sigma factor (sigma-70 family)
LSKTRKEKALANDNEAYEAWRAADAKTEPEALGLLLRVLRRYANSLVFGWTQREMPELSAHIVSHALENRAKFDGRAKFTTWFYRLARNKTLDWLKAERRRRECSFPDTDLTAPSTSSVFRMTPEESRIWLEQLQASLPPEDQAHLKMRLEGRNDAEVAEQLRIRKWQAHARWKALKSRLRELSEVGSPGTSPVTSGTSSEPSPESKP